MADINAARAAVAAAQASKEDLLRRAVEGEPVTEAELEAADAAYERAARVAELEEARAKGARQRAEKDAIERQRAAATETWASFNAAVDARIAAAAVIDDMTAQLADLFTAYDRAGLTLKGAAAACHAHNAAIEHAAVTNSTLMAMDRAMWPWCPKPNGNDPIPVIRPKNETFIVEGAGFASKRRVLFSLESYERAAHRRLHPKAADSA